MKGTKVSTDLQIKLLCYHLSPSVYLMKETRNFIGSVQVSCICVCAYCIYIERKLFKENAIFFYYHYYANFVVAFSLSEDRKAIIK